MLGPIQKRWVDALRSGKYKQGRRRLRKGDEHCCLGVLCELAAEDGVVQRFQSGDLYSYGDVVCLSFPPIDVMNWVGLATAQGFLKAGESLTRLNDDGVSFDRIAEIIETNAEELFTEPK